MKLLSKEISGPFTIPSGIVTTTAGIIAKFAKEIPQLGVLTTKSIGLLPRYGNIEPILAELPEKQTYINAVGLSNPGCEAFRDELKQIYPLKNRFLLVSIFDSSPEGLIKVAKTLENHADGFELNFSCPHAEKGYGMDIGSSCELTELYTRKLKENISAPIFVKMTPNVVNYEEIVESAIKAGADGITAINTVGPKQSDVLSHGKGGISGLAIRQRALECVALTRKVARKTAKELGKKEHEFPIIGTGGIFNADDVREFKSAGATIFGIGSAFTGFDTERIRKYFRVLEKDLENSANGCDNLIFKEKLMEYEKFKITKIEEVDNDLRIFYFDKNMPNAKPGQFVFCWIKGLSEKPFSLTYNRPLVLVVRAIGPFTKKMFELKEGESIFVRGPYGTSYDVEKMKDCVLVGGGTGIAPLYFLAKVLQEDGKKPAAMFIGGRTKNQLVLKDEFGRICQTFVSTDDGSEGFHGLVTDLLRQKLENALHEKMKSFSTAGPEIMMKKSSDIAGKYLPDEKIILSIERYYKCGVGICGICECDGLRTCIDGPILPVSFVKNDFGRFHRDKSGKKEEIILHRH